jgi:hypothetical protein
MCHIPQELSLNRDGLSPRAYVPGSYTNRLHPPILVEAWNLRLGRFHLFGLQKLLSGNTRVSGHVWGPRGTASASHSLSAMAMASTLWCPIEHIATMFSAEPCYPRGHICRV